MTRPFEPIWVPSPEITVVASGELWTLGNPSEENMTSNEEERDQELRGQALSTAQILLTGGLVHDLLTESERIYQWLKNGKSDD
jgi:hypothetical protein